MKLYKPLLVSLPLPPSHTFLAAFTSGPSSALLLLPAPRPCVLCPVSSLYFLTFGTTCPLWAPCSQCFPSSVLLGRICAPWVEHLSQIGRPLSSGSFSLWGDAAYHKWGVGLVHEVSYRVEVSDSLLTFQILPSSVACSKSPYPDCCLLSVSNSKCQATYSCAVGPLLCALPNK